MFVSWQAPPVSFLAGYVLDVLCGRLECAGTRSRCSGVVLLASVFIKNPTHATAESLYL